MNNVVNSDNIVFVFGSNESGVHGAGAALVALNSYGAKRGVGFGPQGMSFAIPTKDWRIRSLDLETIQTYVNRFKAYAKNRADQKFMITRIGCGLAGFMDEDIAPMFDDSSENCWFDEAWSLHLGIRKDRIWGTYSG